jgi:hypothetical protein
LLFGAWGGDLECFGHAHVCFGHFSTRPEKIKKTLNAAEIEINVMDTECYFQTDRGYGGTGIRSGSMGQKTECS